METNLEKLTQTLYDEGLARGRAEGERMEREARGKAEKIVTEAEAKAARIVRKATEQAEELRTNTLAEVVMAGREAIGRIKSELAGAVVAKSIGSGVHSAGIDPEFIKRILVAMAHNWRGGGASLVALLPESEREKLDAAFSASAGELLKAGIEVGYSASVKTGFRVGEKGGGYYISFSDENFEALLGEYLRERAAKILYAGTPAAE